MESLKDAALSYAARGWAVFPLVERDKVPAVKGGFKVATDDADQIEAMWEHRPGLNVGIATGTASRGLVVIDLDVDDLRGEDGVATLREWEREHGELPETACAETGSGGMHLYYMCDRPIACSVDNERGVDVRGDGGYVVAPPSIHPNGRPYAWEAGPEEGVARADDNVYAFIRSIQGERRRGAKFRLPSEIKAGERNDTIARYACSMQSRGDDDALILAACEAANRLKCKPPLPEAEVQKIVESVTGRYEKGDGRPQAAASTALIRKSNGQVAQTIENCCRALAGDPALAGRFYYDERAYTRMVSGPLPWDDRPGERAVSDADYCGLAAYLEVSHGLLSKQKAIDAVTTVSMRNRRNLVAEWLDSLEWDGEERMGTLLPCFLGAGMSDYNVAVMRLFMLGAVARAYEPGTKFDYMPVLVGRQGIGKSMFLRRLGARSAWYCDNLNTIEGDAAAEKLRGMWIVEMAELLATKRSRDVEAIKAFVTSTVDTIRPKYARETEQRPRGCVFAGTTNDMQFLTDSTGNRRFLPVDCGVNDAPMSLFAPGVEGYFAQAWAEAVHVWKSERPDLVLDGRLQKYAMERQEAFLEDDPRVGIIQQYLDERIGEELAKAAPDLSGVRVCAQEIIDSALPDQYKRPSAAALGCVNVVHKIMQNRVTGWKRYPKAGARRCAAATECSGAMCRTPVPRVRKAAKTGGKKRQKR